MDPISSVNLLYYRSASISPQGMEIGISFGVNAVFGWMPCHNLQQKLNIFGHLAISCFAVTAASLFLNFCFTVPNVASMSN